VAHGRRGRLQQQLARFVGEDRVASALACTFSGAGAAAFSTTNPNPSEPERTGGRHGDGAGELHQRHGRRGHRDLDLQSVRRRSPST
jgi:hypothetical protein